MRTWSQLAAGLVLGLALLGTVSVAAQSERRAHASARPVVSKITPSTAATRQRITLRGRHFVRGLRRNRVVFLGGRGRRDDVSVRATRARGGKLMLRPTRRARSGRVQVVNRFGSSRPSRARITFDDDRDGLSNERERKLGTNPRKRDTDGDGLPDGSDPAPLTPQPGGGGGNGGGGGGGPAPPPADCPAAAVAGPGPGPASSFAGIENVIQEGRSLIAHDAYTAAPVGAYCLYRKRRGDPDAAYQSVGRDTGAGAGTIRDGQRPFKTEDYVYRTDAVTSAGVVAGSNTVEARGAGSIANVDGWAQLNQTCTGCGSAAVQTGALKAASSGAGVAGPPVGQVAVYERRLDFEPTPGAEWVARVLTPQTPSAPGTYASANLTMSDEHPATARGSGTVADVTDSGRPFINVELRAGSDGELRAILTDSNGSVTYPTDLRSFGVVDNTYLVVQPLAGGKYEARFKTNVNPGGTDIVIATGRDVPSGMASAWLSLRNEVSSEEAAEHDARFDEVFVTGQTQGELDESFGGVALNIQVPTGFDAQPVATGLTAPTAIEFAPGGDMFIAERQGVVKVRDAGTGAIGQVLDIRASVNAPVFVDQGLLGFALDPGFDGDGDADDFAYLSYTQQQPNDATRTVSRVERVHWNGSVFDPATRTILVGADDPAPGSGDTCPPATTSDCLPSDAYTHSAGGLAFGDDGMLWISVPDGASPEGPQTGGKDPLALRAQNDNSLAGKLLRVDPATGDGVPGNPSFSAGDPDSPASRTWVKGFRNPFRLAQRPDGTRAFYLTDVGWGAWEEANVIPAVTAPSSRNYGWPCREGDFATSYAGDPGCAGVSGFHDPLFAYDSSGVDHAIVGSAFYTGGAWPAPWTPPAGGAAFFYSDYPSGEITRLETDAADAMTDLDVFASGFSGPVDISEGPADFAAPAGATALYVVNIGDVGDLSATDGRVWRITGP
jgi:glucose/arabinose dehydrogenase